MGYRLFELKWSSVAILWSDGQDGNRLSELGTWALSGDTVKLYFDQSSWTFLWKKGRDQAPNFYSSLEMLGVPWIYNRVDKKILAQKAFAKTFIVKGKAVCKNGLPLLRWNRSDTTYIRMDNLSAWEKNDIGQDIEVHAVLTEDNDGELKLSDWKIITKPR